MRPINCGFRSLKGKESIVHAVNKLFSLSYKVQQTFFIPGKKHELGEQRETNLLLKVSRYSFSEAIPIFFNRLKSVFFPCLIAIKFSPMIDYRLKFVKI